MKKLIVFILLFSPIWLSAQAIPTRTPTQIPSPTPTVGPTALVKAWFILPAAIITQNSPVTGQPMTMTAGMPNFGSVTISGHYSCLGSGDQCLVLLTASQPQINALITQGSDFICYDSDTDRDTLVNAECDLKDLSEIDTTKWTIK